MRTNEAVSIAVRVLLATESRTHQDLADHLGVRRSTVTNKMNGLARWSVDELDSVGEFFGIPPKSLLDAERAVLHLRPRITVSG